MRRAPGRTRQWTGWLLLAVVLCQDANAADVAQTATSPFEGSTKHFLGLSVPDAAAAAEWYARVLDLRVQFRREAPDGHSKAVILSSPHLVVELMQHREAVPLSTAAPSIQRNFLVHGIFKTGIFVRDLDAVVAHLREHGVQFMGSVVEDREARLRFVLVRDLAGNVLQFFGEMPAAQP